MRNEWRKKTLKELIDETGGGRFIIVDGNWIRLDGDAKIPSPIFGFREGFYENLDHNPIYIQSKNHLRNVLKEKGLSQV